MKIYLLFLALFASCRANQVSRSAQPQSNPELASNDLNRDAYSDGLDYRRNIDRVEYTDRLSSRRDSQGQAFYDGSTRGFNDDSYRYPMGIARSTSNYDRNFPTGTSQNDILRANRPYEGNRNENPVLRRYDYSLDPNIDIARNGQRDKTPVVLSRDALSDNTKQPPKVKLVRSGQGGSPNDLLPGALPDDGADVGINAPIRTPGNYDRFYFNRNYVNNPGSPIGSTNYLDRSVPIGRVGTFGREIYENRVENNQGYNSRSFNLRTDDISQEANDDKIESYLNSADGFNSVDDINSTDSVGKEAPVSKHYSYPYSYAGYSYPEIEYDLRVPHVSLFPGGNEATDYDKNGYNNDIVNSVNNNMVPDIYDTSVFHNSEYINDVMNNEQNSHYVNDDSISDPYDVFPETSDSYEGLDYNSLDSNYLETYSDNYITPTSTNKLTDKDIIAAYNDSIGYDININANVKDTNYKDIVDRFGEPIDIPTMDHRSFHNIPSLFHEINLFDDNLNLNSNSAPKVYGGECQCSNTNDKRVCSCEYSHSSYKCDGSGCKRISSSTSSSSSSKSSSHRQNTCEYCKTHESHHSSFCESCKAKEILKDLSTNYCETCKTKEKEISHNIAKEINNYNTIAKEIIQKDISTNYNDIVNDVINDMSHMHQCENCKDKETHGIYETIYNNIFENKHENDYNNNHNKHGIDHHIDNSHNKHIIDNYIDNNYINNNHNKHIIDNTRNKQIIDTFIDNNHNNHIIDHRIDNNHNKHIINQYIANNYEHSFENIDNNLDNIFDNQYEHHNKHQNTIQQQEKSNIYGNSAEHPTEHSYRCSKNSHCRKCSCGCGCCGCCGCCGGCGCSGSHKTSSSHNGYGSEEVNNFMDNGNNYGSNRQSNSQNRIWFGAQGRGTHSDLTSTSNSNSGSTGVWTDFGSLDDGNRFFGSSIKGGGSSKNIAGYVSSGSGIAGAGAVSGGRVIGGSKIISGGINGSGSISGSGGLGGGMYGGAVGHAGAYGHIFGSFGGGGIFGSPHVYGR